MCRSSHPFVFEPCKGEPTDVAMMPGAEITIASPRIVLHICFSCQDNSVASLFLWFGLKRTVYKVQLIHVGVMSSQQACSFYSKEVHPEHTLSVGKILEPWLGVIFVINVFVCVLCELVFVTESYV